MSSRSIRLGIGVVIVLIGATTTIGQTKVQAPPTAEALEQMAARSVSLEQWADRIVRDGYLLAAKEVRDGRLKAGAARLSATVTFERVQPDPNTIDVCFETCLMYGQSPALNCYVSCNAPKPPPLR